LLKIRLGNKRKIIEDKLSITSANKKRLEYLLKKGLVSVDSLSLGKMATLNTKLNLEENEISIEKLNRQKIDNHYLLTELLIENDLKTKDINRDFENKLFELKVAIKKWKYDHLITSPIGGKISFINTIKKGYSLVESKPILAIYNESAIEFGMLTTEAYGAGNIEIGNEVLISIDNYPHHQYGQIKGVVNRVALFPNDGEYEVTISLSNGIETTTGNILPTKPLLKGKAKIITKKISIFNRLTSKTKYMLN
jgi:hypothetical protein